MSHAFDGYQFSQLAALAERLVTRVANHERRLVSLIATVEGATAGASTRQSCLSSAPEDSEFALTLPSLPPFTDWLAARELCVESREQRLDAEAILSRLVGDPPVDSGRASKRGRVLVVDDVEDNRDLVAVCLEHAGYETLTATNGCKGSSSRTTLSPAWC